MVEYEKSGLTTAPLFCGKIKCTIKDLTPFHFLAILLFTIFPLSNEKKNLVDTAQKDNISMVDNAPIAVHTIKASENNNHIYHPTTSPDDAALVGNILPPDDAALVGNRVATRGVFDASNDQSFDVHFSAYLREATG